MLVYVLLAVYLICLYAAYKNAQAIDDENPYQPWKPTTSTASALP